MRKRLASCFSVWKNTAGRWDEWGKYKYQVASAGWKYAFQLALATLYLNSFPSSAQGKGRAPHPPASVPFSHSSRTNQYLGGAAQNRRASLNQRNTMTPSKPTKPIHPAGGIGTGGPEDDVGSSPE